MKLKKLEDSETQATEKITTADRALEDSETQATEKITTADRAEERYRLLLIERYKGWLATHTRRNTINKALREMSEYAQRAGKTVLVGERKVQIFAPFRPEHSALWVLTRWQSIVLMLLALGWCLGLQFFRQQTLLVTMTIITTLYLGHLLMTVGLSFFTFRGSTEEEIDDSLLEALRGVDWPCYTILCPLYREARIVPQFARAMTKLDYPVEKLQILFLTEVDDSETRNAIRALSLPPHFKIVTVPEGSPRTKPRACNFGLMQAIGQYLVIYDAEDIPEPTQLKKAVLTFANHGPDLACVQAKLNFYNPYQNLLTRWFTAEYSLWFDLILPGLQSAKLSLPLGGTSNHFPTQILRALGGWDAFNVTEDCDLGLRLSRYQMETVILNSTTYEEANSKFKNWIWQRSRWIKGYMQTYLINMRRPWRYLRPGCLRDFVSFQLVIGGKTAFHFLNPFLWCLFVLYLFLGQYVAGAYHQLFPQPLLYAGAFSLLFGNFFYIYMYMLACLRRKQYSLILCAVAVPCYWAMMSIAAFLAFFQLIVKPHYWEKTEHGLHLGKKPGAAMLDFASLDERASLADAPTMPLPVPMLASANKQRQDSSITSALQVIATMPAPAITRKERVELKQPKRAFLRDRWFLVTMITALTMSISACWYFFQQHEILLYGDAYSHMMLARRFFDSQSPGVAQLGGVWLPLPQVGMLPFIWNDYLWRSGLAGSFSSMICYVVASCFIFLMARRITHDHVASYVGTLAFLLNPNILYLQSTPLSELICIATSAMACYFFLSWTKDNSPKQLVWAAASIFLVTLARYDGWALFMVMLPLIVVVGLLERQRWNEIQGNVLVFGALAGLGIVLWLIWNQIIFHDMLYFQKGPYSAQGQAISINTFGTQQTYLNLWHSIQAYGVTLVDTFGSIPLALGLVALIVFLVRKRLATDTLAVMMLLVPFAFYVLAMYAGQVAIYVPGADPLTDPNHLFNVRFGSAMAAPVAVCLAILAGYVRQALPRHWTLVRRAGQIAVALVIVAQAMLIGAGGIITLEDGIYGGSCAFPHPINVYLAQHYNGGRVLENTFTSDIDGADAGLMLKDIVYDGSATLWAKALKNPAEIVDWVIVDPGNSKDIVAQNIDVNSLQFQQNFTLVYEEHYGLRLYHRNGLPPLPSRPIPSYLARAHSLCNTVLGRK